MRKLLIIASIITFTAISAGIFASTSRFADKAVIVQVLQDDQDKKEIKEDALPEAVRKTINKKISNLEIDKVYQVTKSDKTKYYMVNFSDEKGQSKSVNFDAKGNVIDAKGKVIG